MATFNLNKFIKEAMGAQWGVYRTDKSRGRGGDYLWWSLQEIDNGSRSWKKWLSICPTLETAYLQAKSFYIKKKRDFTYRYTSNPKEVDKYFKVYLGYNPSYGAYMCSIGPYVGEKPVDAKNRFSYFTQRFQNVDEKSLQESFQKYCAGSLEPFKDVLSMDDLSMDIAMGSDIDDKSGNVKWEHVTLPSLTSPEAREVFSHGPIQGQESKIYLNNSGKAKVINSAIQKYNMGDRVNMAINFVSGAKGVSEEQIRSILNNPSPENPKNETDILNDVIIQLQSFFPFSLREQAQAGGWSDILEQTVNNVAEKLRMTSEQVWEMINRANTSSSAIRESNALLNKITKELNKAKKQMIKSNTPKARDDEATIQEKERKLAIANSIVWLPTLQEMAHASSGQQIPLVLQIRTSQKSMLKIKLELLEAIISNGTQNLQAIADQMTNKREKQSTVAQGKVWTTEDVQSWIDYFNQERQVPDGHGGFITKTYEDLKNETLQIMSDTSSKDEDADIEETAEVSDSDSEDPSGTSNSSDPNQQNVVLHGSFDSFDQACKMANLYFVDMEHSGIDTKTRALRDANLYQSPPAIFARDSDVENVNSEDLTRARQSTSEEAKAKHYMSHYPGANRTKLISKNKWEEIAGPKSTKKDKNNIPSPNVQEPVVTTEPSETKENDDHIVPSTMLSLSKNIVNNLIKISSSLKNEGKIKEANEINKIINKYNRT